MTMRRCGVLKLSNFWSFASLYCQTHSFRPDIAQLHPFSAQLIDTFVLESVNINASLTTIGNCEPNVLTTLFADRTIHKFVCVDRFEMLYRLKHEINKNSRLCLHSIISCWNRRRFCAVMAFTWMGLWTFWSQHSTIFGQLQLSLPMTFVMAIEMLLCSFDSEMYFPCWFFPLNLSRNQWCECARIGQQTSLRILASVKLHPLWMPALYYLFAQRLNRYVWGGLFIRYSWMFSLNAGKVLRSPIHNIWQLVGVWTV